MQLTILPLHNYRSILTEKLGPIHFNYSADASHVGAEDAASLKEIYSSIVTDAAEFAYRYGFRPYQMSIWLTITVKILMEAIGTLVDYMSSL